MKRSLISIKDLSEKDLLNILKIAENFKKLKNYPKVLKNKFVALIFQKPSTRTRVSFSVAIENLGGKSLILNWNELQLGRGETIEDTVRTLERYVNIIAARVFEHEHLIVMDKFSKIPIINLLSNYEHPLQTLADLLTIKEKIGFKNLEKIVYVGDGNNNVCHSLILACDLLNLPLIISCPKEFYPDEKVLRNSKVRIIENPYEAVKDANVIYTDVWVSMGKENEEELRKKILKPYQVNSKLIDNCKKDFIFMHCLPAHRGEEVTNDVIDSKNSVVFDQAENRLWTSMAALYFLCKK